MLLYLLFPALLAAADPPPNPFFQELYYLRSQNAYLKDELRKLESGQEAALSSQERLEECEKKYHVLQIDLENLRRASQLQLSRSARKIQDLTDQLEKSRANLNAQARQYESSLQGHIQQGEQAEQENRQLRAQDQAEKQRLQQVIQEMEQRASQSDRLVPYLRQKADTLQKDYQTQTRDLQQTQNELREAQQQLDRQKGQKGGLQENLDLQSQQILSLRRQLEDERASLDSCQRQNTGLNTTNDTGKQQIQAQTKRLEAYEKSSLTAAKEKEELQRQLSEKTAAIEKWRQENGQLRTQLDSAVQINSQLRGQIPK